MWESYILKRKGYSLFEQSQMTAEERKWVIDRVEEENQRAQEMSNAGSRHVI
jgi:hypothetical protein